MRQIRRAAAAIGAPSPCGGIVIESGSVEYIEGATTPEGRFVRDDAVENDRPGSSEPGLLFYLSQFRPVG